MTHITILDSSQSEGQINKTQSQLKHSCFLPTTVGKNHIRIITIYRSFLGHSSTICATTICVSRLVQLFHILSTSFSVMIHVITEQIKQKALNKIKVPLRKPSKQSKGYKHSLHGENRVWERVKQADDHWCHL